MIRTEDTNGDTHQAYRRASAGEASHIALRVFNDSEALTALVNGSGNLELIGWHTSPLDLSITRGPDSSAAPPDAAQEVALTLLGRTAITAIRSGNDNLKLIVWNVPAGLTTIDRIWDSGTSAGEAKHIAMTALSDTLLVTAVCNGSDDLLLISWRLETGNTLARLTPEGNVAGNVSLVTIAAVDANNVVTAVRNGSGKLELIGWSVSPENGQIDRWPGLAAEAGEVGDIALLPIPALAQRRT